MPKVKLGSPMIDTKPRNKYLHACIDKQARLYGTSDLQIATALNMSLRTYQRKRKEGSSFSGYQLMVLFKTLHIGAEDILYIMQGVMPERRTINAT